MKYFLIFIRYKQPMETIEQHTAEHRSYMKTLYAKGLLLLSGPFVPRTAGVLIACAEDRSVVESFVANDPFRKNDVADYEIQEFNPVLWAPELNNILGEPK